MTDSLTATILKTAIEAIPLLTQDNFSIWQNQVINMMDLQEDLYSKLMKEKQDAKGNPIGLSQSKNVRICTIITSKLNITVQANIITPDNEKDAHQIWADINEYFASNHASNQARVFKEFLRTPFTYSNIPGFITDTKTAMSRLHEVGIDLPTNIIAYLILEKLPPNMDTVIQQITHADKEISLDQVLDHLQMFNNNRFLNKDLPVDKPEENSNLVSFLTSSIRPCNNKWHNPKAAHPKGRCWKFYPHLKPSFPKKKKNASESTTEGTSTN